MRRTTSENFVQFNDKEVIQILKCDERKNSMYKWNFVRVKILLCERL
jgi:hypothetical protein